MSPEERVAALEAQVAALDTENAELQQELVRRGVKLSCSKVALARATLSFEETQAELQRAQMRLVHDEKLLSIGKLAASVAHELNSPVGALGSARDTIARGVARLESILPEVVDAGSMARVQRLLDAIGQSAEVIAEGTARMDETVRRLSDFAQLDRADHQRIDLNRCVQSAIDVWKGETPPGLRLKVRMAELPPVMGDPRAIGHVMLHLLRNAVEATGGEGDINVETSVLGDTVRISVRDNGRGIPAEALPELFEPSLQRRGDRMGAGMGLPTCARLVADHDGDLYAESVEGQGAAFHVTLPAVSAHAV